MSDKRVLEIDKIKRDRLVKKYNLLRFSELKQPVLLTIDEFFDGNNDEASIAPNLVKKRPITEYYKILNKNTKQKLNQRTHYWPN